MSERQSWKEGLTQEEIAKLEKIDEKVTEHYSKDPNEIPLPESNEHEDNKIIKDIIASIKLPTTNKTREENEPRE